MNEPNPVISLIPIILLSIPVIVMNVVLAKRKGRSISLYFYFNLVWLIFHSRNRAFHDILGGTIVIFDGGIEKNSINEVNCNLDKIIKNLEQDNYP